MYPTSSSNFVHSWHRGQSRSPFVPVQLEERYAVHARTLHPSLGMPCGPEQAFCSKSGQANRTVSGQETCSMFGRTAGAGSSAEASEARGRGKSVQRDLWI
jgi:hypothetical protein